MVEQHTEDRCASSMGARSGGDRHSGWLLASILLTGLLAACASKPASAPSAEPTGPAPIVHTVERFHTDLGSGLALDYQVEKKPSKVNSRSCFAFITGKLSNQSGKVLSRKSVLDVQVFAGGAQLYRDLSSPLADIPPGGQADIEMVVSPVFANGCPPFDKVNTTLRSVFQ